MVPSCEFFLHTHYAHFYGSTAFVRGALFSVTMPAAGFLGPLQLCGV